MCYEFLELPVWSVNGDGSGEVPPVVPPMIASIISWHNLHSFTFPLEGIEKCTVV